MVPLHLQPGHCSTIGKHHPSWHMRRTPLTQPPLLSVIQDIYNRDEYVLKDGDKIARVHPTRGVKQGCPLSPLLFPLYNNDIDDIAEGVSSGAITGTAGVHVSHMLYADDLITLLTNEPRDMQIMLSRLAVYARNKHLIVNTSKSKVVHFNSAGENVPVLMLAVSPFIAKIILGIWAWFSTRP